MFLHICYTLEMSLKPTIYSKHFFVEVLVQERVTFKLTTTSELWNFEWILYVLCFLCFTWVAIPRWRSLCTRSSGRRPTWGRWSWPLQKFGAALIQTHARARELGVDLRGVVNLRSDRKLSKVCLDFGKSLVQYI